MRMAFHLKKEISQHVKTHYTYLVEHFATHSRFSRISYDPVISRYSLIKVKRKHKRN